MIYDCFLFYNEFDILEIRLNELYDVVDEFIIVESRKTFTGKDKPLFFTEGGGKQRFARFMDKIHCWVTDPGDTPQTAWDRERKQRDFIKDALFVHHPANDDDIIFFSDVEEITRGKNKKGWSVKKICERIQEGYFEAAILEHRTSYYYFNNVFKNNPCPMAKVCTWRFLKGTTVSEFRSIINSFGPVPALKDCGWNFSNLGTPKELKVKLEAFSHQEYAHLFTEEKIAENKAACRDLFERPGEQHEMKIIPLDNSFPDFILQNKERFKDYIAGTPEDWNLIQFSMTKEPVNKDCLIKQEMRYGQELMDFLMGKPNGFAFEHGPSNEASKFPADPAGRLKVYWFGYGGHAHYAEALRSTINDLGMQLITIHEHSNADVKWDRLTILNELKKADIIILPCQVEDSAKSNNKLTQALSLGKPVVCSPMPAYLEICKLEDDEDFPPILVAYSEDQWRILLKNLRTNTEYRIKAGETAKRIAQHYSIDQIGQRWLTLFDGSSADKFIPGKSCGELKISFKDERHEKLRSLINQREVDIIIPTSGNLELLKICVDSIRSCTKIPYRIIVIDNGAKTDDLYNWARMQEDIYCETFTDRLVFSAAINAGLDRSDAEYVCFLNDDTIVSNHWLEYMIESCKEGVGAVGVLSNCDKGWLHNNHIEIDGIEILPGVNTLEQITPIIPKIKEGILSSGIYERAWIAFYCTLIPRKVIDKVGLLDEGFSNSGEDVDYCKRIKKAGYKIIQDFKAFVFHFGAVGRKQLEKENFDAYHSADRATQNYLRYKCDNRGLIVLYSGKSWEKWDASSIDKGGIGGSETWQIRLAEELASVGYRVVNFCDCSEDSLSQGKIVNGVMYFHYSQFKQFFEFNWIDLFISSRTTEPIPYARATKKLVMVHDVVLMQEHVTPTNDKWVDYYLCLSKTHKEFFSKYHAVDENRILITSNGIDLERFSGRTISNPYSCIYSSSPDRGLENLLNMWPEIKRQIPTATLDIYYGFNNYWSLTDSWRSMMEEKMKYPGITYHGRVGQAELANAFKKSAVLLYPCSFEETFCITALEAMAAGCTVISSRYWGLKDTVAEAGVLIPINNGKEATTEDYKQQFIKLAVEKLTSAGSRVYYEMEGPKRAQLFTWKNVANQFIDFMDKGDWRIIQDGR